MKRLLAITAATIALSGLPAQAYSQWLDGEMTKVDQAMGRMSAALKRGDVLTACAHSYPATYRLEVNMDDLGEKWLPVLAYFKEFQQEFC